MEEQKSNYIRSRRSSSYRELTYLENLGKGRSPMYFLIVLLNLIIYLNFQMKAKIMNSVIKMQPLQLSYHR